MTNRQLQDVTEALRNHENARNQSIKDISLDDLFDTMGGCAYWNEKHYIRREMLIKHLEYQCRYLNDGIDDEELNSNLKIFKKYVVMI
jgi:hypothetical protein